MTPYRIRNYRPADFPRYARLRRAADGDDFTEEAVAEALRRPDYDPARDLFLAEQGENLVGYLKVLPEPGIGRAILEGWVRPAHRRRGLAGQLLGQARRRAGELGLAVVQANVMAGNGAAEAALARLGFKCVRRFMEYEMALAGLAPAELAEAAEQCRHLERGEEAALMRLQNRSFAGTWGYNPNTLEMIAYRTGLRRFSVEDVILADVDGQPAAYCWTELERGKGRVYMLGVDPDYRGRGLGRRVLLAGLAYLRGRGAGVASLTVDGQNETACVLYHAVGFVLKAESRWYELAVA